MGGQSQDRACQVAVKLVCLALINHAEVVFRTNPAGIVHCSLQHPPLSGICASFCCPAYEQLSTFCGFHSSNP